MQSVGRRRPLEQSAGDGPPAAKVPRGTKGGGKGKGKSKRVEVPGCASHAPDRQPMCFAWNSRDTKCP
eukprot:1482936-Lingulodinium_polyedra.AAC.1